MHELLKDYLRAAAHFGMPRLLVVLELLLSRVF